MMGALLLQTKRELGGTIQLPKEDRFGYSTSARLVSNNHMPSATGHVPCESRQAFLPQVDTRHAWLGRNLRIDSRSAQPSEILLRMREAVPVELFGHAMLHWDVALGLNPQADESLSKGGRDLVPYRRSLVVWRPLYAFRSHTVTHFDHSPRASLSNTLLQQMLPNLLEVVFLETTPVTEEKSVSRPIVMRLIFHGNELESTNVVGKLEKTIVTRLRISINNRILRERVFNRGMKRFGNYGLAIVIVNFDFLKSLQVRKMVKEKVNQIALHAKEKGIHGRRFSLYIGKRLVSKREMLGENGKRCQQSLSVPEGQFLIVLMAVHKRPHVERNIGEVTVNQGLSVWGFKLAKANALVMENQRDEVESGTRLVTGFVDKDGQLTHCANPPRYKKCRGTPPGSWKPPLARRRYLYTTSPVDFTKDASGTILFTLYTYCCFSASITAFERSAA